jgi:hypothetical protein
MTEKIRSERGPLIKDYEIGLRNGSIGWGFNWIFGGRIFWGNLSRRGVHVNTPEIGSRGGVLCFWGNIGVLR